MPNIYDEFSKWLKGDEPKCISKSDIMMKLI